MQLFYNSTLTRATKEITFDKTESRHIVRVLRKKEGETLHITNGKGFLFFVEIIIANDKKCVAAILKYEEKPKEWSYYLHIAIAPTKNNDRLEWFLEKATEIGIDEITPIICQNSERKIVKTERLEKIIQSAVKQSLKFHLPKLNTPVPFSEFIEKPRQSKICIAHCRENEKQYLNAVVKPKDNVIILIGPEGDFSLEEIEKSKLHKSIPVSLGKSRLRTETAALVALQNIAFINQ